MKNMFGPQTFGYSNAVVKGMKSFLLPQSTLRELVVVGSVDEVVELLENTVYKEEFVKLSALHSGVDLVEYALSENLANTCRKLVKITPREAKPLILSLMKRFDIYNIKTILLGKNVGESEEQISRLIVNAGSLRKHEVKSMLAMENLEDVLSYLQRTEYRMVLKDALEEYRRTKELTIVLNALDMHYYTSLALAAKLANDEILKKFIIHEVNSKNIGNILRAKANGLSIETTEKLLISGGTFEKNFLLSLARLGSVKEIVEKVNSSEMNEAYAKYEKDKSLVHFEIMFEKQRMKESLHYMKIATLSTAAIVGYLFLKELEINNIRRLVRAKEYRIPQERIMEIVYNLSEKV